MTTEETLDRLTIAVESLASAHASGIDGLIRAAEGQQNQIDAPDEQIESLIRAAESQRERIDALIRTAEGHQDQIDAHDAQIETLIALSQGQASKNGDFDRRLASLLEATANLERQWQAYINTLPRR